MIRLGIALFSLLSAQAFAEGSYIDELKKNDPSLNEKPTGSYTESLKAKVRPAPPSNYIEAVKKARPQEFDTVGAPGEAYTEAEKKKLEPVPSGGAIEAVRQGRSEIKFTKKGTPHYAAGIRVGVSAVRDIKARNDFGQILFESVYGTGFSPDISFFGEWQLIHSEYVGSLGVQLASGFTYHSGYGAFESVIPKPTVTGYTGSGGNFSGKSRTKFYFVSIPVSAVGIYRFNLMRWVRPYIGAGPSAIGYYEGRNDGRKGNRGYSFGLDTQLGAALLLDFLSKTSSFDIYDNNGIHHTYLTLEYHRQVPFVSEVEFATGVVVAGLAFEF